MMRPQIEGWKVEVRVVEWGGGGLEMDGKVQGGTAGGERKTQVRRGDR